MKDSFLMFNRILVAIVLLVLVGYGVQKYWTSNPSPYHLIEADQFQEEKITGAGVAVAVIDEGFDESHFAIQKRFSPYQYNTDNSSRDISESLVYENGKYKFQSHGTHVTGIISGLAPDVRIIPIKIGLFGGDQAFVKALNHAAESPASIVNISMLLSYTGRAMSPNVKTALIQLAQANKLIVIAAGNEKAPMMRQAYTASLVELAHNPLMLGRLLLVGASTLKKGKESLADFSNFPGKSIHGIAQTYFITAPGDNIYSTITGGLFGQMSGTSMATPMVVGVASLLKQAFPEAKADTLAELMLRSARKTSLDGKTFSRGQFGAGIVNLKSALNLGKRIQSTS